MEIKEKKPPVKLSELMSNGKEPGPLSYMEKKEEDKRPVGIHKRTWQVIVIPLFISLVISVVFLFVVSQLFVEKSQITLLEQRIESLEEVRR